MGFFKNIINKIRSKKQLSEKLKEKNIENTEKVLELESVKQKKFDDGLKKSSAVLSSSINEIAKKYVKVNEEFFEQIEEMLVSYDVGIKIASIITQAIKEEVKYQNVSDFELIKQIILDKMLVYYIQETEVNTNLDLKNDRTNTILIFGVNGVGKTTSIAKLAYELKQKNKKVLLVAGDTFRAGAIEQLKIWADRISVEIVLPNNYNQDPASVIYNGVKKANEEKYDVVICDTSGRLQNKTNLMEQLKKINKVIKKFDPTAPHENLLVLDATLGQSGLHQAKSFKDISDITGIILTKMDSTSKGGIILAIKDYFNIPVKYIGLGEGLDDLSPFDLEKFIIGLTRDLNLKG